VAYGVPYSESRERFLETLEIIKRAWTQPTFSYEGKYYSFTKRLCRAAALSAALPADPRRRC
jgi:alkanesulfonate monooxygenase SsuD/methylene tetrahydromethanopterin reductase-like flavin-dependent oxidoreductase (luciferase family)